MIRAAGIMLLVLLSSAIAVARVAPVEPSTNPTTTEPDLEPTTAPATTQASDPRIEYRKMDLSPALLTAKIEPVYADQLFAELAKKAQVAFVSEPETLLTDPPLNNSKLSGEWNREPFWNAVMEACEAANVKVSGQSVDLSPTSVPQVKLAAGLTKAPTAVEGSMLFRAVSVTRSASQKFSTGEHRNDEVVISIQAMIEPKLAMGARIGPPKCQGVKDDNGHDIPVVKPTEKQQQWDAFAPMPTAIAVRLGYPSGIGPRIPALHVTVPVLLMKRAVLVTIPAPLARPDPIIIPLGPNKLTFSEMRLEDGGKYHVTVQLDRGTRDADTHWNLQNDAFRGCHILLVGDGGSDMGTPSWGSTTSGKFSSQHLTFTPPEGSKPTEWRILLPAEWTAIESKFELKDLPLP